MHTLEIDTENHETWKVFPPMPAPPLYEADRSLLNKVLVSDSEIDQWRIDAIRGAEAVTKDLARLQEKPATLAHVLSGPDGIRKLLTDTVDFAACERVQRAAAKLEQALGANGMVADPRPGYGASLVSMAEVRDNIDAMLTAIAPYREMLKQLKAKK